MFDIGFTELLLVGLVALLVLGPERLPGAVRTTGLWVGRLKRSFSNIKAEVEREIGADEIRRQLHNERILDLEREMKQSILPPTTGTASSAGDSKPAASSPAEPASVEQPAGLEQPAEPPKTAEPAPRPDRSPEP
ncbi:Sec-independent protein translocase protein TatB [Pseudomonas sp.]|uniref:Sec-independent protein translocase protein TatB n=1 Tax=Pseudomonas sp. TaxID=306 RepID=UPI003D145A3E